MSGPRQRQPVNGQMQLDKRWWMVGAVLLVVVAARSLGLGDYLSLASAKHAQAGLQAWTDTHPVSAAAGYFAMYLAVAALALPGVAVLTLVGGAMFGLPWGVLLVSFASSAGATLAFLGSRWFARDWVRARFRTQLENIDAGMRERGNYYLFSLRLVPVIPFFAINLAMGLTNIRLWTFYWVSQLGMLAGTVVYVNAGTQLAQLTSASDIVSPAVFGSLLLLAAFPLVVRGVLDAARRQAARARWERPRKFDRNLVIIGGGSAGLVTAYIAAALKAKVTLVERHKLGGDCLNTGCVPSKALLRSANFLSQVKRANEYGIRSAQAEFDFADVMERVQRVIRTIEPHDSAQRYTALGVDVVQGSARLVSPWVVEVTGPDGHIRQLTTRSIVIAAGARPTVPPIPGLEAVNPLTSDNVWSLRKRPERLVVLGGGPIGTELTQAFARLGSRVTQVEMASRLLMREDPDVSAVIAERLMDEGVDLRLAHVAKRVEHLHGIKRLVVEHHGVESSIDFDEILIAVGRSPNLSGYGLEELGVNTGRTVDVNGYLQTNFDHIFAAGDVAGPFQFTHTAAHQAWYAAVNALMHPFFRMKADYRVVPWATFSDPEVARVGLNETQAKEAAVAHEVTTYGLDDLDRAIADGQAHGFVKVLTEPGRDRILGVTIVGAHAAELLAEYVLAMKHGIGLGKILSTIHTYPTLSEANKHVAGKWKREHAPQRALRWLERFHDWRRRDWA